MANTTFARSDALTVEHWAQMLTYDIVYRTPISPLIGTDENSIIHRKTEIGGDAGDKVTFPLMAKLTGEGWTESELASGAAESLSLYSDSLTVNELGHTVGVDNKGRAIGALRTRIPLREAARKGLRTWWAERLSVSFFNQVCGYTVQTNTKYTGLNAVTATDANHTLRLNTDSAYAAVANDQSLASGDVFTLQHIEYAVTAAKTMSVPMRPINIMAGPGGQDIEEPKYVMYLHPLQVRDLRTADSGRWFTIHNSGIQGGNISKNPIYTGAIGEYNNVILREALHVPYGVNSASGAAVTTVRRAVLLGAQAAGIAFAENSDTTSMAWNEELFDHKRRMEISSMKIFGLKKCVFRSEDLSTIVVPTYAA